MLGNITRHYDVDVNALPCPPWPSNSLLSPYSAHTKPRITLQLLIVAYIKKLKAHYGDNSSS